MAASHSNLALGELIREIRGTLRTGTMPPLDGEAQAIGRIVTESDQVQEGDLYWAIVNETTNGNDFVEEAMCRGAAGAKVRQDEGSEAGFVAFSRGVADVEPVAIHRSLHSSTVTVPASGSIQSPRSIWASSRRSQMAASLRRSKVLDRVRRSGGQHDGIRHQRRKVGHACTPAIYQLQPGCKRGLSGP